MPTYNLGVPNPPNAPSVDVPKMQTNTNTISTWANVDHQDFANANYGTHKQVSLQPTGAPTPIVPGGSLYANTQNGQTWPVWVNEAGSTQIISFAGNILPNGFCSLSSQIIQQWGSISLSGVTHQTATQSFNIAFPNACFNVQLTLGVVNATITTNSTSSIVSFSSTNFTWVVNQNVANTYNKLYWVAIGW